MFSPTSTGVFYFLGVVKENVLIRGFEKANLPERTAQKVTILMNIRIRKRPMVKRNSEVQVLSLSVKRGLPVLRWSARLSQHLSAKMPVFIGLHNEKERQNFPTYSISWKQVLLLVSHQIHVILLFLLHIKYFFLAAKAERNEEMGATVTTNSFR